MNQARRSVLTVTSLIVLGTLTGCGNSVVPGETTRDPSKDDLTGSLYGLEQVGGQTHLIAVSPESGDVTVIGAALPRPSLPTSAVLDHARGRYSYLHQMGGPDDQLTTVDLATGAVLAELPVSPSLNALSLDVATGHLIGHQSAVGSTTIDLVSFDPLTGVSTTLSSYPSPPYGVQTVYDGVGTIFGIGGEYLGSSPANLFVFDVATGAVTSTPIGPLGPSDLQLDTTSHQILFMQHHAIGGPIGFARLDTASVQVKVLHDPIPDLVHVLQDDTSYDPDTHRYFFVGGPDTWEGASMWVTGNQIFTLDARTGTELGTSPVIKTQGEVYGLRFSP